MDESILALSKYRMQKATDDLNSSEVLLNEKYYAQSINRSYYAIFHAVRAILAFDKFDSKKHSGIIAYFNKNYVKSGIIEKQFSSILISAQQIRTESDYDDLFIATQDDADSQFNNAKLFISRMVEFICNEKKN
ncbi:MAG: HEPN domain-containing protein [Bacteroidota bacterium]